MAKLANFFGDLPAGAASEQFVELLSRANMSPCIDWLARTILTLAATLIPFSAAAVDLPRSRNAEAEFRSANSCPVSGLTQGVCKGYVIDRIIPPVCGGAEDPANMQWQTIAEAKAKDKWERIGCRPGRKQVLPPATSVAEAFPLSDPPAPIEATLLPGESETEK